MYLGKKYKEAFIVPSIYLQQKKAEGQLGYWTGQKTFQPFGKFLDKSRTHKQLSYLFLGPRDTQGGEKNTKSSGFYKKLFCPFLISHIPYSSETMIIIIP